MKGKIMKLEIIKVTPDKAKKWLAKNHPHNRSVSWNRVEAFVNDMVAGNWRLTHQGIAFDGDGYLIDGQHRLHAVVNSGKAIEMAVVTNETAGFHDPIDRGAPRSVAMLAGMKVKVAASLKVLKHLESGSVTATGRAVPMTVAECLEIAQHHQKWLDMIARRTAFPQASERLVYGRCPSMRRARSTISAR